MTFSFKQTDMSETLRMKTAKEIKANVWQM